MRGIPWEPGWSPSSWAPPPPDGLAWARWGSHDPGTAVHGFVEDRRLDAFARGSLQGAGAGRVWATEPDFSVLSGMPDSVLSIQVYRARYLGDQLRRLGLRVLPVLQWAEPDRVPLCAWGIRPGSAVAVRAPSADLQEIQAWKAGFLRSVDLLSPSAVLVFGVASRVVGALDSSGAPWRQEPIRRRRGPRELSSPTQVQCL